MFNQFVQSYGKSVIELLQTLRPETKFLMQMP